MFFVHVLDMVAAHILSLPLLPLPVEMKTWPFVSVVVSYVGFAKVAFGYLAFFTAEEGYANRRSSDGGRTVD